MKVHDLDVVGPWTKSTFSAAGNCVEVAKLANGNIAVRDSKNPDSEALVYTRDEFQAFTSGVLAGEFDNFTK